jgi:hypothetical protein
MLTGELLLNVTVASKEIMVMTLLYYKKAVPATIQSD